MIEKIIHQIWIGPKDPPWEWINTWKSSGIPHKLWTESEINSLSLINQDKFDFYIENQIYFGAADILRLEILYNFGGIYIDADIERLRPMPNDLFLLDFFAVYAPDSKKKWPGRISNAVLGCSKNNEIIYNYIKNISTITKLTPVHSSIGGSLLTRTINNLDSKWLANTKILPYQTFYPISKWSNDNPSKVESIATHHWGSTKKIYK